MKLKGTEALREAIRIAPRIRMTHKVALDEDKVLSILDAIDEEALQDVIARPSDADGVVIEPGTPIALDGEPIDEPWSLVLTSDGWAVSQTDCADAIPCEQLHVVHGPTVVDVLEEMLAAAGVDERKRRALAHAYSKPLCMRKVADDDESDNEGEPVPETEGGEKTDA